MISFRTSIGMAIRGEDLDVVCVRGRFSRVMVAGHLRIEQFRKKPAAEVAREYKTFRNSYRAQTTSAIVALPRGEGLFRLLEMPAEVEPTLAQSLAYQVDLLHPFEEGAVNYDYSVLPASKARAAGSADADAAPPLRVAVALMQTAAMESLYEWFREAGIDVAAFTFSTAVMYQALRKAVAASGRPSAGGAMLIDRSPAGIEILGMAADGRFCCREASPHNLEHEIELCAAELRLPADQPPLLVSAGQEPAAGAVEVGQASTPAQSQAWRPAPLTSPLTSAEGCISAAALAGADTSRMPPDFRLAESFTAYAAALGGLSYQLPGLTRPRGLQWNLLPVGKRVYRSHWAYAAAFALGILVVLLLATRVGIAWGQDRAYHSWLSGEIRVLEPKLKYLDRLDTKQKALLMKLEALEKQRQGTTQKLEVWRELTRLLPDTAWLNSMQFSENRVTIAGQAQSASAVLQAVGQSPYFEQPEFLGPLAKTTEGREAFQLRMRVRERPVGTVVAIAPPQAVTQPATQPAVQPAPALIPKGGRGGK